MLILLFLRFNSDQKNVQVSTRPGTMITCHAHFLVYLTGRSPLSLFNEDLPLSERTLLPTKIGQITYGETEIRKPTLHVVNEKSV